MNRILSYIATVILMFAATSCSDERLWNDDGIIGEGESTISTILSFKSFEPALSRESGGTDGTILDNLSRVTLLVYNEQETELIYSEVFENNTLSLENNTQQPEDGVGVEKPVRTPKANLGTFKLPYGRYKMYVVGNAEIDLEKVQTAQELRETSFEWKSKIDQNNQMFGWLQDKSAPSISLTNNQTGLYKFDAPTVTINKSTTTLNAWLVRLASKVTISYDASDLNENIFIFLKSVTIKDIPASCALGVSNTPELASGINGETIYYYKGKEPTADDFNENYGATLTSADENFGSSHSHDSKALFFFENNQGIGKNKAQDAVDNKTNGQIEGKPFNPGQGRPDGIMDFPDGNNNALNTGFKDEKRAGTYIEVEAYYRSNNHDDGMMGEGPIKYRFMLGKDIKTNYDAERNYHYKLTLKFNGNANDPDWHIVYEPEPGIYVPNPYYISYLYDKSMELPVQITGEITGKLTAEIIENEWMPYGYFDDAITYPENEFYNPNNSDLKGEDKPNDTQYKKTQKIYNGFLSLINPGVRTTVGGAEENAGKADGINSNYWLGEGNYSGYPKQGIVEYDITEGSHNIEYSSMLGQDKVVTPYKVEQKDDNTKVFTIPMYTRPKNLVKASGYTGNNPYVGYQRKAKVKFTATINEEEVTKTVEMIQVRRIINPKGIWRDHYETNSFDVHLLQLDKQETLNPWESEEEFKPFESMGPWSAEVIDLGQDNSWIKLDALSSEDGRFTSKKENNIIYGETGSTIDFKYQPIGTIDKTKSRCGIIRVRYHNYTCEHLIFVRQGYAPLAVVENGAEWYSFNMNSKSQMTKSPCEEGSLFKRFRWDIPIDALNDIEYPFMAKPGELKIFDSDKTYKWTDWYTEPDEKKYLYNDEGQKTNIDTQEWELPTVEGEKMKVASVDDYLALYNSADVQQGFGILYDGSASKVMSKVKDAYCYYNSPTESKSGRGMRGCFVYNEKTGAQIFLPAGGMGYGCRRAVNKTSWADPIDDGTFHPGMLIYGRRNTFMKASTAENMPLLFDLYRRPGAIYWTDKTKAEEAIPGNGGTKLSVGWDFNLMTLDFYPISKYNVIEVNNKDENSDALRIRCVKIK